MDALKPDETSFVDKLFPFTWTRSVLDIRIGILTLREKWARLLAPNEVTSFNSAHTLPGNILPTPELVEALRRELTTEVPSQDREARSPNHERRSQGSEERSQDPEGRSQDAETRSPGSDGKSADAFKRILQHATTIDHPWHIFELNGLAIRNDYALLTRGRQSQPIPPSVQVIGSPENIFIEEGAAIGHSILNAATGPIYIGRNAVIMEGTMIRGPFALCEGAVVKMGATIYGATTIGPHSIAGGEIKNSVIFGYSNKAHHGYLGDSVIGEWCNLGAGTSNSNLKNNAGTVKVWDQASGQFREAGLKCGLLMGDYSRSAINTSFNTGTVAGVCCNIFGEGLVPKYIPSFSWGVSPSGLEGPSSGAGVRSSGPGIGESAHSEPGARAGARYTWEKALRDIANWKKLKNQSLTDDEIQTLKLIFERY